MNPILKKYLQKSPALILRLMLLTWITTKFNCYPLWIGSRFFPFVPIHEIFLQLPLIYHDISFWLSCVFMVLTFVFPKKVFVIIIISLEIFSCILDQNRWQPWEYFFIFMMAAFVFVKGRDKLFFNWQIILVGLYFFSGISKCNTAFIHDIWKGLILHNWLGFKSFTIITPWMGYVIPTFEMTAAMLLFIPRYSKLAVVMLCLMHLFILLLLGPYGLNMNNVIWLWNLLMPLLLILLFYRNPIIPLRIFFSDLFTWIVILFIGILPLLNLFGKWDRFLSFTLYNGATEQMYICTEDMDALNKMSIYLGKIRNEAVPCKFPISVYSWSMKEMNSPVYPEERVFRSIGHQWKKQFPNSPVKFYIFYPGFGAKVKEFIIQ